MQPIEKYKNIINVIQTSTPKKTERYNQPAFDSLLVSLTIVMNLFTDTELLETTAALFLRSILIMKTFEINVYQTIMVRLILDKG